VRFFQSSENTAFLILGALLGLVVSIGVWVFQRAIDFFHEIFAVSLAEQMLHPLFGAASFIFSLALAGWVVGKIMDHFIGEERHHGVAGIMESVAMAGGKLRYRRIPFKAVASALSLGAGASVGPEDPSVQIGANLGSFFGENLHLNEERTRILVAAGAASAISAAFKAPIAGVFFALEVILNSSYETASVSIIVLAAVIAAAFMQAVEPGAEFALSTFPIGGPGEIALFVPLGLLLAPVAALFIRSVYWQHDFWHKYVHIARPYKTALAGALVGFAAIFLPQIMGTGRDVMNSVLTGEAQYTIAFLLILAFVKLLMTSVSMAGGFVGGIFAPALVVGTMLGSAYGQIATALIPGSSPQSYAIAGMAGMMAGVVRSPITAIMLVFELTNNYRLILPLMLTTVICVYLAEKFEPLGIYALGLVRQGVQLPTGRDIDLMQSVTVAEAMKTPPPLILESASLVELRDALRQQKTLALCVVDAKGDLTGIVTLSDLQNTYDGMTNPQDSALTVGDICTRHVVTASPDDVLWTAIRTMSKHDVGRLPVVKSGTDQVVGIIGRHGVMLAYNIAITRKLQDQHSAERIRLHTLTGAHVFEVYLPPNSPIAGHTISEIHWPAESVVASIQRQGKLIVPHGVTELKVGDLLAIVADPAVTKELTALIGH